MVGSPSSRIQALADGIFAVAMTILVLELHVPELGQAACCQRCKALCRRGSAS
jgi:uncharacterized membrane protein